MVRKTNGTITDGGANNGATAKTSPSSQDGQRWAAQLEEVERKIGKAKNTVALRDKDLKALKKEFDELDKECQEKYGCPLMELQEKLTAEEAALADLIGQLERDLQYERNLDTATALGTA